MFGWRKKKDGFEWREYVRTTVLIRRKNRQEKIDAARQAAVDGIKDAGARGAAAGVKGADAAVRGTKAAGGWLGQASVRAFRAGWSSLKSISARGMSAAKNGASGIGRSSGSAFRAAGSRLGSGAQVGARKFASAASGLGKAANSGGGKLAAGMGAGFKAGAIPAFHATADNRYRLPLAIAGGAAAAVAITRLYGSGLDVFAALAIVIAVISLSLAAGLDFWRGAGERLSNLGSKVPVPAGLAKGAGIAAVIAGAGYGGYLIMQSQVIALPKSVADLVPAMPSMPSLPDLPTVPGLAQLTSPAEVITGRARALSGDTLSIGGKTVMLAGIEAPEKRQVCERPGAGRWRCGAAATSDLAKLVRRVKLSCEVERVDDTGRRVATCLNGETDIASVMVEQGSAFAQEGFFARYASAEAKAREAKTGLWRGTALRPAAYRAERWESASKKSPEGCPIKGRSLRSRGKVYLLPWSDSYDKYSVRSRRGDRWFCSEDEALEAGWKPFENS